jgi:hypothetical protein
MHEPMLINPVEQENWDNLLLNTPGCSFFHTANWADVLSRSYNYQPLYFCKKKDDKLDCLLPIMEVASPFTGKRGACLPFTDSCEPLAANQNQFQELISRAIELGRKREWKYLEFRGGENFFSNEQPSELYYGHILDLTPGQKQLFASLRDSTRRNIQKAEKLKIDITISTAQDAFISFCNLNALTRREHGLPPQPHRFFACLYDQIISRNLGFIVLASLDKRAIAANVYFHFAGKVIYKYGASDKSYQKFRANNLLMWKSVKWSCDHGFKTLCFGRTEPENDGLRQFKNGWGAREYIINYYKYDLKKGAFVKDVHSINPFFKKIMGKLPLPVLKTMGNILYRHMR